MGIFGGGLIEMFHQPLRQRPAALARFAGDGDKGKAGGAAACGLRVPPPWCAAMQKSAGCER